MSFSDDIDDFGDDFAWQEVDAIVETAYATRSQPSASTAPDESFDQFSLELDAETLRELDRLESLPPPAPTTSFTRQTTLLGCTLHPPKPAPPPRLPKTTSLPPSRPHPSQGQGMRKTKSWDFQDTADKLSKSLGKKRRTGKGESTVEFQQFPQPREAAIRPLPQMKLELDAVAAKNWIYPVDVPKRDYQFNIIKHALFENCLVALPTGTGKTFIAAVIMRNYYNWFPKGKVVFVAPTRPLVNQQLVACHNICAIPQEECVTMTGDKTQGKRTDDWLIRRAFFTTPQTLQNDLISGNCDPSNIVLLVIDEAHRASGNHACAQIVKLLMQRNPFFRLLALTATPGSTLDRVQDIIDALRISHIELRNESSLDLRPYIHRKVIKENVIQPGPQIAAIRDALAKLMEVVHAPLRSKGILAWVTYTKMNAYACTAQVNEGNVPPWGRTALYELGTLARAMTALLEASVEMCKRIIAEAFSDIQKSKSKNRKETEPLYKAVLDLLQRYISGSLPPHPKMAKLKAIAIEHFATTFDREPQDRSEEPKMMVFATLRECVDEIVDFLNQEQPLLRATKFIGQSSDKRGVKGMNQKDQLEVIERFKSGDFNILVSTSVGEEGLDIGEVECIVFYDSGKQPVRSLQRAGRTGRRKQGYVHLLEAEGREEGNYKEALATYHGVQEVISRGSIELYADVPRLLPLAVRPELLEMPLSPAPWVQTLPSKESRKPRKQPTEARGTKRKRDADPMRNVPAGASTTFVKATALKELPQRKDGPAVRSIFDDPECDTTSESSSDDSPSIFNDLSQRPRVSSQKAASSRKLKVDQDGAKTPSNPSRPRTPDPKRQRRMPLASARDYADNTKAVGGTTAAWLLSSPVAPKAVEVIDIDSSPIASKENIDVVSSSPLPQATTRRKRKRVTIGSSPDSDRDTRVRLVKAFIDDEAELSGSDPCPSDAESVNIEETEEDRQFLQPLPETQLSPSYPQTQVYRQSMLTQPAYSTKAPSFQSRPRKQARFETNARRFGVSSSPIKSQRSEPDEYEMDGFIVEDDDEIMD